MTIEEKRQGLYKHCHMQERCNMCKIEEARKTGIVNCCDIGIMTEEEVERVYACVFGNVLFSTDKISEVTITPATGNIKDSGERRKFETGAVRDIQEGKGRCDLLPLQEVSLLFDGLPEAVNILFFVGKFQKKNDVLYLFKAIQEFIKIHYVSIPTCCLELAKHFEAGAKKYGENNWQKGIPTHCYIDSALRHFFKFFRGDNDEPHDRAFVWNLLCCIWTCKNKPEMNDYEPKRESDSTNDK